MPRPLKNNARVLLDVYNINLRNVFNEANRHAAFDAPTGKAFRAYDAGRVQIGDDIPNLAAAKIPFSISKPCMTVLSLTSPA